MASEELEVAQEHDHSAGFFKLQTKIDAATADVTDQVNIDN